jgi:N-acyl-D-amino-acid deacylase
MHSHSSLAYLDQPGIAAKTHQGVTSEVIGVDGLSVYPIKASDVRDWRIHLSGLEGNPPIAWSWESFSDYARILPNTGTNVLPLVGHGTLRRYVMGMAHRTARPEELDHMCQVLAQSLEQGAWGLSTGLIYAPCTYADRSELDALARVVARYDRIFTFHMRHEGVKVLDSLEEVGDIGRSCGCRIHVSHLKALGRRAWGKAVEIRDKIDRLRGEGVGITADLYPYTAASTMMPALLPPWVHAAGPEGMKSLLTDSRDLSQIEREMQTGLEDWESFSAAAGWDNIFVSSVGSERNQWVVGRSTEDVAKTWGLSPFSATIRLLLEEEFAVGMVFFVMDEKDIEEIMRAPWVMFCTDGLLGGRPHPRAYATYARILSKYVRDRSVLTLEEAVRKSTSLVAETLGLRDRGVLKVGHAADICIFDLEHLNERATYESPDVHPEGIKYLFVNGVPTIWQGKATGLRAGRPLLKTDSA